MHSEPIKGGGKRPLPLTLKHTTHHVMKTTTDIYKFDTLSISGSYLPAIVNYDYSGMTLEELKPLDDFFMDIRNIIQRRHPDDDISYLLVMAGEPQKPSFELCAVSGLYSECYEVDVMVHAKSKA